MLISNKLHSFRNFTSAKIQKKPDIQTNHIIIYRKINF